VKSTGAGILLLQPEISPHRTMRPPSVIRRITVAMISPPTFSKLTWMPSGVAGARASVLHQPTAFFLPAGDANHTAILDLGNLASNGADRSRSR
jgi:hypothetical protein